MRIFNAKLAIFGFFLPVAAFFLFFGRRLQTPISSFVFSKLEKARATGFFPSAFNFSFWPERLERLGDENKKLAARVQELEAKLALSDFYSQRAPGQTGFLPAGIILRPPGLSYDQIIIDKGLFDGVKNGAAVLIDKDIILGYVNEVFSETSRVVLLSTFGRETNVFLGRSGLAAVAYGRGSGELEISLPRDFPVDVGENVLTSGQTPYFAGFVEKIESSPNLPVKKIRIVLPFNLNNLEFINIKNY